MIDSKKLHWKPNQKLFMSFRYICPQYLLQRKTLMTYTNMMENILKKIQQGEPVYIIEDFNVKVGNTGNQHIERYCRVTLTRTLGTTEENASYSLPAKTF